MNQIRLRGGPRHGHDVDDTNPGQTVIVFDDVPPVLLGIPDTPDPGPIRQGSYVDTGDVDEDGNRLFRWQGWDE